MAAVTSTCRSLMQDAVASASAGCPLTCGAHVTSLARCMRYMQFLIYSTFVLVSSVETQLRKMQLCADVNTRAHVCYYSVDGRERRVGCHQLLCIYAVVEARPWTSIMLCIIHCTCWGLYSIAAACFGDQRSVINVKTASFHRSPRYTLDAAQYNFQSCWFCFQWRFQLWQTSRWCWGFRMPTAFSSSSCSSSTLMRYDKRTWDTM